jgi:hypothetical protein
MHSFVDLPPTISLDLIYNHHEEPYNPIVVIYSSDNFQVNEFDFGLNHKIIYIIEAPSIATNLLFELFFDLHVVMLYATTLYGFVLAILMYQ